MALELYLQVKIMNKYQFIDFAGFFFSYKDMCECTSESEKRETNAYFLQKSPTCTTCFFLFDTNKIPL